MSNNKFYPNSWRAKMYKCRFFAMLVITLVIGLFSNVANVKAETLPDISKHWARSEIELLINAHIVEGRTSNTGKKLFYPEAKITRAEFVVMLVNALKITPVINGSISHYEDTLKHWAAPFIEAATSAKITGGVGDGKFSPNEPITRYEIAVMIVRSKHWKDSGNAQPFKDVDKEFWAYPEIMVAHNHGIISGDEYNNFVPFHNATRAETAAIVARMLYL